MTEIDRKRFTPPEASAYLCEMHGIRRAVPTLAKMRCVSSEGPAFLKANRQVLYTPEALDEYAHRLLSEPMRSTSERIAA